ncbi:MAG: saccharopine dehydrogenase NADP-binding domain-containing protein [Planctomycetota bacterium]
MRKQRKNLLVLGASGSVARAFLRFLSGWRSEFRNLVLLDKNRRVLEDPFLDRKRLAYRFVRRHLDLPRDGNAFHRLLRKYRIDVIVDVTTHATMPMLAAADAAGVSYLNTSLNDEALGVTELVERLFPQPPRATRVPHILCSGMNPGAVNLWIRHGIERFGRPREITHFEYDTSVAAEGWRPLVTWSKHEFLTEIARNPTGLFDGRVTTLAPDNALRHLVDLKPLLAPVLKLDEYPKGFLVLHEENLTMGRALGIPSKFLYAIHPRTMRFLVERFRRTGRILEGDLELGDNLSIPLAGSDTVGVCLEYPRRRVYYMNRVDNTTIVGTNATCLQVATGIYAALFTLLLDRLPNRILSVGDLYESLYKNVLFNNMRVEEIVCGRRDGRWEVRSRVPFVRIRALDAHDRLVV